MCGSAPTTLLDPAFNTAYKSTENRMYIGGGILGTILILLLIVYFVRRV